MTNIERNTIDKLIGKEITNEAFLEEFSVNVYRNPLYVKTLLEEAFNEKNADDVELALFIGFRFHTFSECYVEILCKLLEEKWHYQHENIAMILQKLKMPISIEPLYKTALTNFEYLEYDDYYALAVKCIWALGDINTNASREKLELLAQSDNEIIKKNALHQLERNNPT